MILVALDTQTMIKRHQRAERQVRRLKRVLICALGIQTILIIGGVLALLHSSGR